METETEATPTLEENNYGWYVSRKRKNGSFETGGSWEYLSKNGQWFLYMEIEGPEHSGTYFKTLEEVINVLCEFEINVVNPDE